MKRDNMMADCPEEFKDQLEEIINLMEGKFIDIKDALEMKSLSDLGSIKEAHEIAEEMCNKLY